MCEDEIPRAFQIDLTNAKLGSNPAHLNNSTFILGDVFRISSVKFPPGVHPTANVPPDYVLGTIKSE